MSPFDRAMVGAYVFWLLAVVIAAIFSFWVVAP